ncbi:Uncharacterised protein [Mycolicibacterium vanbaalenii]|uniref:Uncharacterized protein n=1 Tax=Mycolicibacterium vanbaalenii TaxID=110539 RepID=A0A5S9QZ82_MYCVN|nr:Uncharacterised protein [Mycolicibacterium vanbaalenii]
MDRGWTNLRWLVRALGRCRQTTIRMSSSGWLTVWMNRTGCWDSARPNPRRRRSAKGDSSGASRLDQVAGYHHWMALVG